LIARFPALPGYADAHTVLLYVSAFAEELETRSFILDALARGKRVACPRVDRLEHRLRLYEIQSLSSDFEPGVLGIPEPRACCNELLPPEIDWALIPGLAFDVRCERLGRGGGHYDRLMPLLRPDAPRWSLAFECQLVTELPVEPHDIRVDGVVTASRLIQRC
jgi:5-formyltetrahydrofolate cyclo-ligase